MPKRKRGEAGQPRIVQDVPLEIRQKKFQEKLHHGCKSLHRALKVARGLERQKQSKRTKKAQEEDNEGTVQRLNRETEVLKNLDLGSTAKNHLCKLIRKDKLLNASPALPESAKADGLHPEGNAPPVSKATANVTARLLNMKQVKDVVGTTMSSLRAAVGIKDGNSRKSRISKASKPSGKLDDNPEGIEDEELAIDGNDPDTSLENGIEASKSDHRTIDQRSVHSDDEFSAYDTRIVASSEDESQNGDVASKQLRYQPAVDRNLSPSPSSSRSPPPLKKGHRDHAQNDATAASNFLPSLTMGGYWSGSESEPEDDVSTPALRKNRRGQRARQAIWEKKFGHRAKHLQNSKSKGGGRDEGWDPKRGAQESSSGPQYRKNRSGNRFESRPAQQPREPTRTGGNLEPVSNKKATGDAKPVKALHPSWEAAIKAKEQKQKINFAGKKVTFD